MENLKLYISRMEERLLRKRSTYKNIVLGTLVIIVILLTYKVISFKPLDTTKYEQKIDSIGGVNQKLNSQVELFKEKTTKLNLEQDQYLKIADSLRQIVASTNLPCEKVVVYQNKEIGALRDALGVCNKAKAIQVKTITKYEQIVINHDLIAIEYVKVQKVSKKAVRKAKFRSFMTGTIVGAAIITIVVLL